MNLTLIDFPIQTTKGNISILYGGYDAAIILIFALITYLLKKSINTTVRNVTKCTYEASSYTIELRNLPENIPSEQLSIKLWRYITRRLNPKGGNDNMIIDLQVVLPSTMEYLVLKLASIRKQVT